ncbi:MAG TPA: caspase family protein, partial [Actinomycetota bacterium]|nr:caspase family protein [Actinomycetota bacterium]
MRRLAIGIVGLVLLAGTALPALAAPAHVDKWAVIIGVDTHQGRTRNNIGAVGDAMAFRELVQRNGWPDGHVRMLTNEQATQAAILESMQWLVDNCTEESYCIFHFSGHTKQMSGPEGLSEYLWPHDNRFISDVEFADYMKRLRGHAWIDLANCESAGFDVGHGISSPKRLFTGASQETEKGFEYPAWSNSVWTGALVENALLANQGDADGDGHVTLKEALPYAAEASARLTHGQSPSPQHPYIAGGEASDWFPPAAAAPAPARKNCLL